MAPLALFISLVLVGAAVVASAWRGRRIDGVPHCRRCRYNLTGAVSPRCPECGSEIGPRGVRWGARRRRPVLLCVGGLPLLAGLLGIGLVAARVDWYEWMPYRVLLW